MRKIMMGAVALMAALTLMTACSRAEASWQPSGQGDPDVLLAKDLLGKTVQVEVHHVVDAVVTWEGSEPTEYKGTDIGGFGSGYVADQQDVRSLIVTASHVCHTWQGTKIENVESMFGKVEVKMTTLSVSITVISNTGEKYDATVLEDDERNDVCVMDVGGTLGLDVGVTAETTPSAGAALIHTGAPAALWGVGTGAFVRGTSMGILELWPTTDEDGSGTFLGMMLSTNGGSSGGPVWYRGEVVGVLVRGSYPDGNITFSTAAEYIQAALTKARVEWRKKTS